MIISFFEIFQLKAIPVLRYESVGDIGALR